MPTTKTRQADQRHSEREYNVVSIKNSAHGEHQQGSFVGQIVIYLLDM